MAITIYILLSFASHCFEEIIKAIFSIFRAKYFKVVDINRFFVQMVYSSPRDGLVNFHCDSDNPQVVPQEMTNSNDKL